VTLPDERYGTEWAVVINTATGEVLTLSDAPGIVAARPDTLAAGSTLSLPSRSLVVLQRTE
jgi:glycogen operon protein